MASASLSADARSDRGKGVARKLRAAGREVLVSLDCSGLLLRVVEHSVECDESVHMRAVNAAYRRAAADATWVEADEIELSVEDREGRSGGGEPVDS